MKRPIRKKCILLLEMLIALMLVVLCFYPLLKPHIKTYGLELNRLEEMELGRLSRATYVDLKKKLYEKDGFSWKTLCKPIEEEFDPVTTSLEHTYKQTNKITELDRCNKKKAGIIYLLLKIEILFERNSKEFAFPYTLLIKGESV